MLIAILCSLLSGCRERQTDTGAGPVRIGVVTSFTGSEARFGLAQKYGYEMALAEINAAGGVLGRPV
ncbi:MAG TPA: ABC transporter substrate-binding protein, partial [Blastocatellia bacterium]|nr:ABC transporter substrate-binding protein [Blastocatellia bacterium]